MRKDTQKLLEEKAAKFQDTRNKVYFAMNFMHAWLEASKEREQEDEVSELYFQQIRDSIVALDDVREYLDLKINGIKKDLRNKFIDEMLKEEKRDASKKQD